MNKNAEQIEKYKNATDEINRTLASWDPIGVGEPWNLDEYSSYAPPLYSRLLKGEDLKVYLVWMLENMGLEYSADNSIQEEQIESVLAAIAKLKG